MDCNLTIKRASKKNQNQVFEILESEYTIQLEEDGSEAELNIEISMEKRINYEEGSGFTWHKSWNIPSIEVKISKRDLNSIKAQLGITRVYCEITSGYPIRKMVEFYIQEVTVEGETRKEIGSNGVARFSNLKFSETSFNHEVNLKLHSATNLA